MDGTFTLVAGARAGCRVLFGLQHLVVPTPTPAPAPKRLKIHVPPDPGGDVQTDVLFCVAPRQTLFDLFSKVRFPIMSKNFVTEIVRKDPLMAVLRLRIVVR